MQERRGLGGRVRNKIAGGILMTDKFETTPEHFEIFKAECEYWIERLGLQGWHVTYKQKELREPDWLAECNAGLCSRAANISLNTFWNREVTEEILKRYAFHEVGELLLWRVEEVGMARFISPDEMREAIHEVIRTLENCLWKPEYQRRGDSHDRL